MGDKYIIEIEKTYAPVQRRGAASEVPRLYRAKGFNSLVFDGHGLNKLEKYDPDKMAIAEFRRGYEAGVEASKKEQQEYDDGYSDGYDAGLNDAWEVAKEFFGDYVICLDDREQLTKNEVAEKYRLGTRLCKSISLLKSFFDAGPEYAIESLRLWKEKSEEIRVGDEECIKKIKEIAKLIGLQRFFNVVDKIRGE